jgi:phosphatidate phosphatase APP1
MPDWTNRVSRVGSKLDDRLDALKYRLRKRAGSFKRLQVLPYRGFGNSKEIYLKGRVLSEREAPDLEAGPGSKPTKERIWTNIMATYRRFHSIEVPRAVVRVSHGGESRDVVTNEDGYFELHLTNSISTAVDPWREIKVELLSPKTVESENVSIAGQALIPSNKAQYGIISDVDDTIIVSHATNLLKVAYTTFARNARGRVAFPGVAALYRALQAGTNESGFNPIFYVSSSPWNLYDLLLEFMQLNDIPVGPILLQDYGLDENQIISASHRDHKLAQIRKILETYPDLPFILIGDSGQHDPEIYRKVLEEVPARIKAIYIRDVTGNSRDLEVRKLAREVKEHGGELILVQNSLEAAKHAVERGFISAAALSDISGEKKEAEAAAVSEPEFEPEE